MALSGCGRGVGGMSFIQVLLLSFCLFVSYWVGWVRGQLKMKMTVLNQWEKTLRDWQKNQREAGAGNE